MDKVYLRTDYFETMDDAYSFPSYSTDKRYDSDEGYVSADQVVQKLHEVLAQVEEAGRTDNEPDLLPQIEADLTALIEEIENEENPDAI